MSNENFKHHENRGKVDGGLTCTFQGTLFLILLCKVNDGVEFENHIFVRICDENCTHLTLQTMFISDEKPKKNRCPCNYFGNGSKNVFVRVELIFPLFCLFQCEPLTPKSTASLGSMSPPHTLNGTVHCPQ